MSGHTPGPWASRNGRIYQVDREELTIAHVARSRDGDYSPSNARLIAAAPELLEALERLVNRISYYSQMSEGERPNIEQWEYTEGSADMTDARAAIAKAKRES